MMKNVQTSSTVVVAAERKCPRCGAMLGGFGLEGLCGACMFDVALEAEEETAATPGLLAFSPRRFGGYELLEEIAHGGMGVVFKARQVSLNRIVAVKMILRGEFASVAELARFRAEAETAARLQHPNIVAIHEVGEQEAQPFFSMDYVEGRNLAQLVGNTPLPATRAAKYLKTIAEAVQYAHDHGVLHRDLKPSNVLIDSANDQPRVTDFGLAKRLEGDASLTVTGQVLGSPNFMPPEQAAGRGEAIGPVSDVYSLGAVLYHTLTGRPPFAAESVPATLRLVAESEAVSPRLLAPSVPPDLETICLKCLQKEPARRYASAQELADELGRYLRDDPIHARPVSQAEKFWLWCRRNAALASAGAAAMTLLLVVAIGSPIAAFYMNRQRREAEAEKRRAQTETARSQQVAQFLQDMLKGVGPGVALGRDTTMLREILDRTAERIAADLKDQPLIEAELRNTLGEVYDAIGQAKKAEAMHRRALELRTKLLGAESLAVAASQHNLGRVLNAQARGPEAVAMLRQALATRRRLLGNENLDVAESADSLGLVLCDDPQTKRLEAEPLLREALALRRKLLPPEHHDVAASLDNLAEAISDMGKGAEAEALAREALAMQRKLLGNEHPGVANSLGTLAVVLFHQGRDAEAETNLLEGIMIQRKVLGNQHPALAKSLIRLAEVLSHAGRQVQAEVVLREGISIAQNLYGKGHPVLDWPPYTLALILRRQGKTAEAETLLRETLSLGKRKYGDDNWLVLSSLNYLADLLRDQNRNVEAHELYREGLAIASRMPNVDEARSWSRYGSIYTLVQQAKLQEAEVLLREAMTNDARNWLKYPSACQLSAEIFVRQGKFEEAEQFFATALTSALLEESVARHTRGHLRARRGRWKEAAADFSKALELDAGNAEHYHRLAPLLVQTGQLEAYRENCRKSLERFAQTQSPRVAERIARDCLILPASGVDLQTVAKMAGVAVSANPPPSVLDWTRITKGLAEYRLRHWTNAVELMEQALASPGVEERDLEGYLVLAMAKQRLNQPVEARIAMAKAMVLEQKLTRIDSGDLGQLWGDWIIAHFLLSEAKLLFDGTGSGETETSESQP